MKKQHSIRKFLSLGRARTTVVHRSLAVRVGQPGEPQCVVRHDSSCFPILKWLIIILLAGIPISTSMAADANSKPTATIRTKQGRTVALTDYSQWNGSSISSDGFEYYVRMEQIQEIHASGKNTLQLVLADGAKLHGMTDSFTIKGETDFGDQEFDLPKIESVKFSKFKAIEKSRTSRGIKVVGRSGKTVDGWIETLEANFEDFSFKLDLAKLSIFSLLPNPPTLSFAVAGSETISGKLGDDFRLSAGFSGGTFTIRLPEIGSVELTGAAADTKDLSEHGAAESLIKIMARSGRALDGWVGRLDLNVGDFSVELQTANLSHLSISGFPSQVSYQVAGLDGFSGVARGNDSISGRCAAGTFSIAYEKVSRAELKSSTPEAGALAKPVATFEDSKGIRMPIFAWPEVSEKEFDIFYPSTSFQSERLEERKLAGIKAGDVWYLFQSAALLSLDCSVKDKDLLVRAQAGLVLTVPLAQLGTLAVPGLGGKILISAEKLRKIDRLLAATTAAPFFDEKTCDMVLTTKGNMRYFIKDLLVNAENTIRPGYFLVGGGRLFRHTSSRLPVKSGDNETTLVRFDKIKSLRPDAGYGNNKRLHVLSQSGSELVGKLDLEAIKESNDKTYLSDEGLLAKLSPSTYIFVPIANVRTVESVEKGAK